uniref:Uncharacterized protein n=1 Tax=Oryza barthii TaxID=65489 RepID=A0A0D3GGP6_9ORYZ
MSTSDDAALSAAINSVTDAATSAIRKTLRPADDTVSPDDLAAAQAHVEATTAATVKAVQDAISVLVVRPSATSAAVASPSSSPTMVTVDAVALRAALGLPPTAPVDNTSGAPVTIPPVHPSTTPLVRPSTTPDLTCQASSQHSASILLNNMTTSLLAVSVLNIKALVPVVLDLGAANYSKWRCLFLVTLGKYALSDLVSTTASTALLATAGGNRSSTGGTNPAHATGFGNPS